MQRYCIFLGKGIEGAGVTRFALELAVYFEQKNIYYDVIAYEDKKFVREKSHQFPKPVIKWNKKTPLAKAIEALNGYSKILVQSLPIITFEPESITSVRDMLLMTDTPLQFFHHNHSARFYSREACIDDVLKKVEKVFVHSLSNPLVKAAQEKRLCDMSLFTLFSPSMDVKAKAKEFWVDIKEQDKTKVMMLTRTTPWKGYELLCDFHNAELKKMGIETSLVGMDKGPAIIQFKDKRKDEIIFISEKEPLTSNPDNKILIYGPYDNTPTLHQLARRPFSFQLTKIKPTEFSKSFSFEFTHIESASIGCVPIFRKEFGEACISRVSGDPIIMDKDSGILFLSENNMPEIAAEMKKLIENDNLRQEQRLKALRYTFKQSDFSTVFEQLMKDIENKAININGIVTPESLFF